MRFGSIEGRLPVWLGIVALAGMSAGCGGTVDDASSAAPEAGVTDAAPLSTTVDAAALSSADAGASVDDPDPVLSDEARAKLKQLSPDVLPPPPADVSNAWADNPSAASFGQRLFFDPRFSGALLDGDNDGSAFALGRKGDVQKVACSGCHVAEHGFSDTRSIRRQISLGAGWGLRRAPSLLDVAQSALLTWDGHRDSLQSQVFGPIQSEVEMNSSRLFAARQVYLNHRSEYEALFGRMPAFDDTKRFPALTPAQAGCRALDASSKCTNAMRGEPGDGAEFDGMDPVDQDAVTRVWVNVGKAIGAYERLLTCGPGPFDKWMRGEEAALSRAAQRGAALFVGKAGCASCHSGPYLSDERFHNVGLKPTAVATVFIDADDRGAGAGFPKLLSSPLNVRGKYSDGDDGRLPAAATAEHEGAFRTPRLRCVAGRPSFMHTGQFVALDAVVKFFSRGGDNYGYPGVSEIKPLQLSPREVADLVEFLSALDGPGPGPELLDAP